MESNWKPLIQKSNEPLYIAIVKALSDDIASGKLTEDFRLPTQRELANNLGIAIGTVTKAYSEAERRGIVRSEGRRGTFVGEARRGRSSLAALAHAGAEAIDLASNHPTHGLDPGLAQALRALARKPGIQRLLEYPPAAGFPHHREAGAAWISGMGLKTDSDSILITAGAQHAMLVAFAAFAEPGDTVATEQLTYPGVMAAAEMLGLHVCGVAADDDGILPDSLEHLCRQRKVRALYLNPTYQNPTNVTLPLSRRKEIAALAEKHDFKILEDDIFRPLCPNPEPFVSSLAPEKSALVVSASKTVATGLRVGFVCAPKGLRNKILEKLQITSLGVPPLPTEILTMWLSDGTAAKIIARRRIELEQRQQLVRDTLGAWDIRTAVSSGQVWVRLPEDRPGMEFAMEAQRRGVAIAPAELFAVDRKTPVNAIRLAVGFVPDQQSLKRGLEILAEILSGRPRPEKLTV